MDNLTRVFEIKAAFEALRQGQCPDCGRAIVLEADYNGNAAWRCTGCRTHGFLARIEKEWLIVDNGYEEALQADLEALKAARCYVREHPGAPESVSLKQSLWQIGHNAKLLNRWAQQSREVIA